MSRAAFELETVRNQDLKDGQLSVERVCSQEALGMGELCFSKGR